MRLDLCNALNCSINRNLPFFADRSNLEGMERCHGAYSLRELQDNTRQEKDEHMFKEFKEFAMRGNVVDMATGIIIGGAFGTIVKSLVDDVIMPPIGLLLGGVDFSNLFIVLKNGATPGPYAALANAKAAGAVTISYGLFFNSLVSFLIVAFAVFMLIKGVNTLSRKPEVEAEPTTKNCTYCATSIPIQAIRCPHCTSELQSA